MKILGVVLAGGRSSRMGGGSKCLLLLGGVPVLRHVLDRLGGQPADIILNINADPALFADFAIPTVADRPAAGSGPLSGVLAGMIHAEGAGFDHILTVACDTPFLPTDLLQRLAQAKDAQAKPIAMAATRSTRPGAERHPTSALWPVALRGELQAALDRGIRKVTDWSDPLGCATVEFDHGGFDPFFNINTPDDLATAESMLQAMQR